MHHACALQRIHLVQLYLTCLDYKIESKDCEGNTCLHYVAITGNCEIAELLIKSAEKMGIRLDQYVNRAGKIKFLLLIILIPIIQVAQQLFLLSNMDILNVQIKSLIVIGMNFLLYLVLYLSMKLLQQLMLIIFQQQQQQQ